jgi:DNA invertase Pin-like site-specific DNA recombinase
MSARVCSYARSRMFATDFAYHWPTGPALLETHYVRADAIIFIFMSRASTFPAPPGPDTSTPSGRAMFQMLGVFAEFERAMIRERVMAGLSRAKAEGTQLGRRRLEDTDADKVAAIVAARAKGTGIRRIARDLGVGVVTVLRLSDRGRDRLIMSRNFRHLKKPPRPEGHGGRSSHAQTEARPSP